MKANSYIREVEAMFKTNGVKRLKKVKIKCSKDVYELFCDLKDATQEKLVTLHLAGDNTILCFQVVHIGSINSAFCEPADIIRTTLLTGAVGLILVHNHPSGNPTPSPEDKNAIKQVKEACQLFHLKLFDSIIIGKGSYYSVADEKEI